MRILLLNLLILIGLLSYSQIQIDPIVDNEGTSEARIQDVRLRYSFDGCSSTAICAKLITDSDTIVLKWIDYGRVQCGTFSTFHRIELIDTEKLVRPLIRASITIGDSTKYYQIDNQLLAKRLREIYKY